MSRRLAQGVEGTASAPRRESVEAVVSLGSNLGDRDRHLREAVQELSRLPLTDRVVASAPVVSTARAADGSIAEAPDYLNAVALVTTRLAPAVLLSYLHAIEERHGRVRAADRDISVGGEGDRTLDLDLIAYGDLVVRQPGLTVPHPRAATRDFVLAPWLEIDPDAALPDSGRVDDLLAGLAGDDR